MRAPNVLRLRKDGVLFHKDGVLTETYLADWAKEINLRNEEPVCMIPRSDLQKMYDEIDFLRNLHSCA